MRRSKILFLCSALMPGAAHLVGCFGNTSGGSGGPGDSGFQIGNDAGIPLEGGYDVTIPEAGQDGAIGAVLSSTPIDFGLAPCGGAAPGNQTYTIKNTGPIAVTYSTQITQPTGTSTVSFSVQSAASGTVDANTTATITLAASAVPTTVPAGVVIGGTLTVTTNVPGFTTVVVPLTVTPQGGSLVLTPATVGFGQQQDNLASNPLTFSVTNVGNGPVGVALGTPSDPEFAVTYTGAPASAMVAPGTSLPGASATFTPASVGNQSGNSAITTSGALCASALTQVPFIGTGTAAPISVGPSPLDFSAVSCGTTGKPQAVTIANHSAVPFTYTAVLGLATGSPFLIDAPSGTVPANGQVVVTVTPLQIPVPGNTTAGAYNDTLTVTTTAAGASPFVIPLNESASGANLALTMATTNFGTVQNKTATLPFTITNTGTIDAAITVTTTGANFAAVFPTSDLAAAGGGIATGSASFTPTTNASATSTLTVTTSVPQCNAPLQPENLTAIGAVPVISSAGSVAVGATCGGAGSVGNVLLTNTGNAPATISSVLGGTLGEYSIVQPVPTTVPANGTATISLLGSIPAPGSTPAGLLAPDTLTFSTNEPSNQVHTVSVLDTILGANLSVTSPPQLACCTPTSFTVNNTTGNQAAKVTGFTSPLPEQLSYYSDPFSSGGGTVPAFSVLTGKVEQFQSGGSGTSGSLGISPASTNICVFTPPLSATFTWVPSPNAPDCCCSCG